MQEWIRAPLDGIGRTWLARVVLLWVLAVAWVLIALGRLDDLSLRLYVGADDDTIGLHVSVSNWEGEPDAAAQPARTNWMLHTGGS